MKPPLRRASLLSLLPLPLLAGWFIANPPPQRATAVLPTPVATLSTTGSLYPPPQVDPDAPPEEAPPTF